MEHFQEDLVCHFSILLAWTSPQCLICKSNWYTIDTLPKNTFLLLSILCFLQWRLGKVHSCGWNCFNFLQTEFNFQFCCTSVNQIDYFWLSCKVFWATKFTYPHFNLIKRLEKKNHKKPNGVQTHKKHLLTLQQLSWWLSFAIQWLNFIEVSTQTHADSQGWLCINHRTCKRVSSWAPHVQGRI